MLVTPNYLLRLVLGLGGSFFLVINGFDGDAFLLVVVFVFVFCLAIPSTFFIIADNIKFLL